MLMSEIPFVALLMWSALANCLSAAPDRLLRKTLEEMFSLCEDCAAQSACSKPGCRHSGRPSPVAPPPQPSQLARLRSAGRQHLQPFLMQYHCNPVDPGLPNMPACACHLSLSVGLASWQAPSSKGDI